MTSLKGDLRSIMGTPFGGVGHAVLIFSRVTRAAFNSDSVVLQLHDRIEMPEEADGKFQVDGLDPGPIRIELEGGTVHNHGWNIDLPDEGVWSLTDLVDAQVDWSPAVIGRAEAAAREALDHADRAEVAADRVGTAEQVGVWASEASSSASAAASARSGAVTARNASQSARDVAEGHANRAATSESNAKASETNAKQSEDNAGDYAAVATTAATEAVDAMGSVADIVGAKYATQEYVDASTETKADKSHKHKSADVEDYTWQLGFENNPDTHYKLVRTTNRGQISILTGGIQYDGDVVNKQYVDLAVNKKADLQNGVVPSSQIPGIALTKAYVVETYQDMIGLSGVTEGDIAVVTAEAFGGVYVLGPGLSGNYASWVRLTRGNGAVNAVNGKTGSVTLTAEDVGAAASDELDAAIDAVAQSEIRANTSASDANQYAEEAKEARDATLAAQVEGASQDIVDLVPNLALRETTKTDSDPRPGLNIQDDSSGNVPTLRLADTASHKSHVVNIQHAAPTGNGQTYGINVANLPGAASAFVIHQYSRANPSVQIDNTDIGASIYIKNTQNQHMNPGGSGTGPFLQLKPFSEASSTLMLLDNLTWRNATSKDMNVNALNPSQYGFGVTTPSDSSVATLKLNNQGAGKTIDAGAFSVLANGDVEISDPTAGVILASPNGTRFRLTVGDDGTLSTEAV